MKLKALFTITLLVAMSVSYPAAAELSGNWVTTAPTTGSPPVGYEWQLNLDGNGWATLIEAEEDQGDLIAPYSQPPATVVWCRVRAWDIVVEAVDPDDPSQGVTETQRYGIWSDLSEPSENNEGSAPGGCGMPYFNPGR